MEKWKEKDMIPSHEGMMLFVGISKTCCYDWAQEDDKKEFSAILDKLMLMQRQELINKGLNGDFNSNICKLALGKHGYHDKQDTNISGQLDTQATYSPEIHRFDGSTNTTDT